LAEEKLFDSIGIPLNADLQSEQSKSVKKVTKKSKVETPLQKLYKRKEALQSELIAVEKLIDLLANDSEAHRIISEEL
jgi:hypothetical protein